MGQNKEIQVLPRDSGKHTAALNTLRGVRREQARTYRAVVNGKLSSDEGARRIYMLREVRASLEAEPPDPEIHGGLCVDTINITGIPSGWAVAALYGQEAHMPTETLHRLKELLPVDAFEPLPDPFQPPPIDDMPVASVRPFLRVHDGSEPVDPEPPAAA